MTILDFYNLNKGQLLELDQIKLYKIRLRKFDKQNSSKKYEKKINKIITKNKKDNLKKN